MTKRDATVQRSQFLQGLRRRRFDRYRFAGSDALVTRVDASTTISPKIRAEMEQALAQRWYPQGDGYLVKWKYCGQSVPTDCRLETAGWDHEHCDGCERAIRVGDTAWLTARDPWVKLCRYCFRRIGQMRVV